MGRFRVFLFCIVLFSVVCSFHVPSNKTPVLPPFYAQQDTLWVDSVMHALTPDQRIAQLFMVAAYSDTGLARHKNNVAQLTDLIKNYHIGGLIFFQGGPGRQAALENYYQSISKVPLMIGMDAEWGLAMRLDSTIKYPYQMMLGGIQDDSLIYQMGKTIGDQCKRLGVQVDFAPVIDINSNPLNPIIGVRSFGENKYNVAEKGMAYMNGLQGQHIIATGKHFPGHGDTHTDSHKTLPVIEHSKERLDTLELYPFKTLFNHGLSATMVAHLYIPAYDSTPHRASTLSPIIVDSLLKKHLGFHGLIFTDALNMKGVSKYYPPGIVDLKALLAGNDVLLFSQNVPKAITEIKKAMARGEITQAQIDQHCRKILMAKAWTGLDHYHPVKMDSLYEDLNTPQADLLSRRLVQKSLTLLSNKNNIIPVKGLDTLRIAAINIGRGDTTENEFQKMLQNYAPVRCFQMDNNLGSEACDSILKRLRPYNLVIVSINHCNHHPYRKFGLTQTTIKMVDALMVQSRVIVDFFADPYILNYFDNIQKANAVVMSYEDTKYIENYSAQLIFGGIAAQGKLSVTASPDFKVGAGLKTGPPIRFAYTSPEDAGVDSKKLSEIDSIALDGIRQKAYPGCVVLVAKDNKVIYKKAFGYHTYADLMPDKTNDIFDLASVTKISATVPSVMKLVDEHKMSLDSTLGDYLPMLKGSNKDTLVIREVMAHQAGLRAWIPFYLHTMDKEGNYKPGIYDSVKTKVYAYRVADHMYINKFYRDTILKDIIDSKVGPEGVYKYSDLGFYLLKEIIERETHQPLNSYVYNTFYRPLGLSTMGYLPRTRFPLYRIPPTAYDVRFRKQLLQGDVDDQGAAMMGGVEGHAGLFSDANDLAVLMQMYMQMGTYGGQRYISDSTLKEFTKCQYCGKDDNRRGAGFDKPEEDTTKIGPTCHSVSPSSFGHEGYTGTYAWADPAHKLVYVFLSNRVYPDPKINKLVKLGTRTNIQQVIYDAIK